MPPTFKQEDGNGLGRDDFYEVGDYSVSGVSGMKVSIGVNNAFFWLIRTGFSLHYGVGGI